MSQPLVGRKDLMGLEQFARQIRSDWADRDPRTYGTLMGNAAYVFEHFPTRSDRSKALAIEFRELSVRRSAELDAPDELRDLRLTPQNWDQLAKVIPSEVVAMRESYAERMLTAWQRADDAWDQIKDRPLIMPVSRNDLIHFPEFVLDASGRPTLVEPVPTPEERILEEAQTRNEQEAVREYIFHVGLMHNMSDYTNAVGWYLGAAFSQVPQDFGRLAALIEQHVKRPEVRDVFYGTAPRGIPPHLVPQFQAVVRATQERRKAHVRAPGPPMIREHTNRTPARAASLGSKSVSQQAAGKVVPAVATPIIAAASPNPATSEAAQNTSPRSLPYLPLAGVLAAGLVLCWFLLRSRAGH